MKTEKILQQSFRITTALLLFFLIIPATSFANEGRIETKPDMDAVSTGTLFLKSTNGYLQAPVLNSIVDIAISGVVSKVTLTQSFKNTSAEWVEGQYVFPLPDEAAVNAMLIRIGDREIIGSIQEKKQAEKQYEIAKQAGHVASIVKQQRPNLFSSHFANVAPGETISIEISYVQTVRFESDRYSLRVPLTLTPRYSNALVQDAQAISPPQVTLTGAQPETGTSHGVTINTKLFGNYATEQINSPSHSLIINQENDGANIVLQEQAYLDRDFLLEWYEIVGTEPTASMWRQNVKGEEYLLATIMPPQNEALIPQQPRELILIIDTSSSMGGASINAAKAALLDALTGLKAIDKFNLIEFNSNYKPLFQTPQPASEQNISLATSFTNQLYANGGTEMMGALRTALDYPDTGLLRQIVFITDGSVGYEESVLESLKHYLGQSRLFTVGIGSAPNEWFMRKVAEAGRGTHHFINDISNVQSEMSRLLTKLEAPALSNISVTINGGFAELVPNPIPDLYANEPLVISAKLDGNPQSITVDGQWGTQSWTTSIGIDEAPETQTGLSTVWARKKIESLEDKQRFHSDPEYYRSLILRTALDHQLLSRFTAFLAIDTTPVRKDTDPLVAKKIPNLIPEGSTMQPIAYPQGAAGSDTLLLLGLLASLVALCTVYLRGLHKPLELS